MTDYRGPNAMRRCAHYVAPRGFSTPRNETVCNAGVRYLDLLPTPEAQGPGWPRRLPCLDPGTSSLTRLPGGCDCPKRRWETVEEVAADIAAAEAAFAGFERMLETGLSTCCSAPLDKSQVIGTGRHKGHGPVTCSACKKMLYRA